MRTKTKNLVVVVVLAVYFLGIFLIGLFTQDREYSLWERRALQQSLKWNRETLADPAFTEKYENYLSDQFPFRDRFRTVKALSRRYLFFQKENQGLYLERGYIGSLDYPLKADMTEYAAGKFTEIYESQLAGTDCKVYLSVIPDKNYFLTKDSIYPKMDYEKLVSEIREGCGFATYLDLFPLLSIEDYYRTDQHWRQENLQKVSAVLLKGMGGEAHAVFSEQKVDVPFYGTYYGQAALPVKPDELRILDNAALQACRVTSYNTGKPKDILMYDREKAAGRDAYEMYLNGADALVVIENPQAKSDKELVIFRDSFTSSLAPLLCTEYAKVTLVDLRYLPAQSVPAFVTFEEQDVLFLYSTLILNNSKILR